MPGRSLMADEAPALASHQLSAGVVGVATEGSAFVRSAIDSCARSRRLASLLAAALAFGIQIADPLRYGRLPWLLRRWLVLQQATRLEAELFRHANISGRKPAASRCFRPCLVQRHLFGHRILDAILNAKRPAHAV